MRRLQLRRALRSSGYYILMFAIPIVLFTVMLLVFPEIGLKNIPSLFKQALFPAVLSCGLMFNFASGNWDLAIGAESVLAAIVAGRISVQLGLGIPGIILGSVLVGVLCGAVSGFIYYLTKVPTIIVTVGLLFLYECIGSIVSGGAGVNISATSYVVLGSYPWNIIYGVAAMFLAYFIFYRTGFGYHVRAVGNNPNIARINGIHATAIKALCLVVSGGFAGLYAAASLCSTGIMAATTQMGTMSIAFDAMMSYLVGKAISFNRNNLVVSMFAGALVMQNVKLLLLVTGVSTAYVNAYIAVLILLLMAVTSNPQVLEKIRHFFRKHKLSKKDGTASEHE